MYPFLAKAFLPYLSLPSFSQHFLALLGDNPRPLEQNLRVWPFWTSKALRWVSRAAFMVEEKGP